MIHRLRVILSLLLLAAGGSAGAGDRAWTVWFEEREPGIEPYPVRMLVSPDYLRIDDGDGQGDYLLYARKSRTVYSINHEDNRILVIKGQDFTYQAPQPLQHKEERLELAESPTIAGHRVRLYRFVTNGEICVEVAAAEKLLPEVVKALVEYHSVLAAEQAKVSSRTPPDLLSACDLADLVLLPGRRFSHGFPVNERQWNGRARLLKSYESAVAADPVLFSLPDGYERFSPPKR